MAASSFHIEECTGSDVEEMVDVYLSAFIEEPIHDWCFPLKTCTWERQKEWLLRRVGSRINTPGPGVRHFKVVESATGAMASWGRWTFPKAKWTEEEASRPPAPDLADTEFPEGANAANCAEMFGGLDNMQAKYVTEDLYVMGLLSSSPKFQRRGCATMLLKHVLDMADSEGRLCYIEATPMGLSVYQRLGWEIIDRLDLNIASEEEKEKGIRRDVVNWTLMRKPQKTSV